MSGPFIIEFSKCGLEPDSPNTTVARVGHLGDPEVQPVIGQGRRRRAHILIRGDYKSTCNLPSKQLEINITHVRSVSNSTFWCQVKNSTNSITQE